MNNGDSTAIFSTEAGFIALNGSVKIQILDFLKNGSKSFDEIVHHTGKAKATISVHLKDLRSSYLLEEQIDPADHRKKIYSLKCQYLARSQEPGVRHYVDMLDIIASPDLERFGCLLCVFYAVQYGFLANGINCDPIMRNIGRDIGKSLAHNLISTEPGELFEEMEAFWEKHDIGKFSLLSMDPLKLEIHDFFSCKSLPIKTKVLCTFVKGVFEGVLNQKLSLDCTLDNISTCHNDFDPCILVIR
ncbi:MAG: ArsR family transcriptional regulator [Methanosarcinaceae archaeon]|nr:ArsR family transcriptional regulator [Methanosarcinaceae archaeon]